MKVVFMGCVASSRIALEALAELAFVEWGGVVTRRASPFNADFESLGAHGERLGCPTLFADEVNKQELVEWVRAVQPDVLFCIGWSFLLPQDLLDVPKMGCVGYHPASLPSNRGRHPIIWAIALRLEQTSSTLFMMDATADSGAIVSQVTVPLFKTDYARHVYERLLSVLPAQVQSVARAFETGTLAPRQQNDAEANSWRKRGKADGAIDWRMSAEVIDALVRALGRPYPGAHCVNDGVEHKIWCVEFGDGGPSNAEPGKILAVQGTRIHVKCGDGSLFLVEHEFRDLPVEGDYLR